MEQTEGYTMPFIGDLFPEMKVHTTLGEIVLPTSYQGHWFVLFSHPGDFTPVCTTEFVAFQKLMPEFTKLDTFLIGLSVEQVYSHMKWIEWIKENLKVEITFPIIADSLGKVAMKLGMIHPTMGTRTVRSVFIVDPTGKIRIILTYPESVGRNIHEILRSVKALQTADANQAATPANWPRNELIGDRLIVPPASTIQEANKRAEQAKAGEIQCYDWWLCSKPLS
ncbi:peroxiredoxin [Fictibacillus nanhaiensis]|uniref:peroxiredoxin n=1 Tax=Fictibacillus nanhaiensis TaxID=742169 RepID=UPI001C94FD6B|nr:peroxiredoxin [Fictibacillus nanhaiensis]MBY6038190.1 peroxiredoxin [Fictibacillus nanhaiensis]